MLQATGSEYYLACRVHRDGTVDLTLREDVLDSRATYAEMVGDLADELDRHDRNGPVPPGMYDVVSAWLGREAGEALIGQARMTLTRALRLFTLLEDDAPMSVAEVARNLYTVRPNLTRQIAKAAKS